MAFSGSSGYAVTRSLDIDSTADDISTAPCRLHGWAMTNDSAAKAWLKFYNKAAATSSDTPLVTFMLPAGASANAEWVNGIAFAVACSVRACTGIADADTGDPGTNACHGNFFYS